MLNNVFRLHNLCELYVYPLSSFYNIRILGSDGHNPYAFENISEVIIDPETGEASEVVVYVMDDSEKTEFTGAGAGNRCHFHVFLFRIIGVKEHVVRQQLKYASHPQKSVRWAVHRGTRGGTERPATQGPTCSTRQPLPTSSPQGGWTRVSRNLPYCVLISHLRDQSIIR